MDSRKLTPEQLDRVRTLQATAVVPEVIASLLLHIAALTEEADSYRKALEAAPHAPGCESQDRMIHTEPCPFWTEQFCLMELCTHRVPFCDSCAKCEAETGAFSVGLAFAEGAERCHPALCNCFKSILKEKV